MKRNDYLDNPYDEDAGTKMAVGCGCAIFILAFKLFTLLTVVWIVVTFLRYLGVNI